MNTNNTSGTICREAGVGADVLVVILNLIKK